MVVRDIERDDIEYISKTLNCLPIAHVDHMKLEKLGHADRVEEMQVTILFLSVTLAVMLPSYTRLLTIAAANHLHCPLA